MRKDGRTNDQLREIKIITDYTKHADGSVLVEFGDTRVICTAMADDKVPPFIEGTGKGWLSAEYAMLPSSTQMRKKRDKLTQDSRSVEISRLIGRALRCAVDLNLLDGFMINVDCDVIQADGGTRTAAITGGYVATAIAINRLLKKHTIKRNPLKGSVAAVSAGIVGGQALLDLCYIEDSRAEADINIVMQDGEFVEIQGTGEKRAITEKELAELIELCKTGIKQLNEIQMNAIRAAQ